MKNIAIIGCGNIAQVHAWVISKIEDTRLVALADTKIEKAQKLSMEYTNNSANVYNNLSDLLINEDIDVLHICTPHYLHVPMAIEAINAGINVFMEKPPAISLDEFNHLKDRTKQSSISIGFCFQNRYNDTTKTLDEIVSSGKLGKVTGARAFVTWRRDEDYYSDDWHGVREKEGGGALINQSIHTLDLILRYLGTPVKVSSSINNHHLPDEIDVEDTVEAWMSFKNGQRACFYASNAYINDAPVIFELAFKKGRVTIIDNTITILEQGKEPTYINLTLEPEIGKSYWGNGHLTCIKDYYSHLNSKTKYQNDIDGVENTMNTTIQIYKNAITYNQ